MLLQACPVQVCATAQHARAHRLTLFQSAKIMGHSGALSYTILQSVL
jgi:hypothetical protein